MGAKATKTVKSAATAARHVSHYNKSTYAASSSHRMFCWPDRSVLIIPEGLEKLPGDQKTAL